MDVRGEEFEDRSGREEGPVLETRLRAHVWASNLVESGPSIPHTLHIPPLRRPSIPALLARPRPSSLRRPHRSRAVNALLYCGRGVTGPFPAVHLRRTDQNMQQDFGIDWNSFGRPSWKIKSSTAQRTGRDVCTGLIGRFALPGPPARRRIFLQF